MKAAVHIELSQSSQVYGLFMKYPRFFDKLHLKRGSFSLAMHNGSTSTECESWRSKYELCHKNDVNDNQFAHLGKG